MSWGISDAETATRTRTKARTSRTAILAQQQSTFESTIDPGVRLSEMGAQAHQVGCFGLSGGSASPISHQGLLEYQGKDGQWKERWFVLDGVKSALIKCNVTNHQPAGSYGSVLGGDAIITEARPLSDSEATFGLEVCTRSGAQLVFRTKSLQERSSWLTAINKTASGFASGVADRLADRELLAGKYSLVRELGRGASGIVSLYTWQGKPFAIKKFVPQKSKGIPNRRAVPVATGRRPSVQASQPDAVPDDVRREVALLKKASSLPNVIRLHDVILDTENRDYYLVMEYMGGGAVAEWDGSRKCYVSSRAKSAVSGSACLLDESTARTYVTNLVLAVQGLHLNNLSHRDIKPENLMANDKLTLCKLGDLGVAHYFKEENGELRDEEDVDAIELWDINTGPMPSPSSTPDGADGRKRGMIKSTKGTYQFLPPESLSGGAYCAFKADIWAIGVTMYALLFGSLPFYSTDVSELFDKIENDPLEFPASCEDKDAKDLLQGILEKDPEKRLTLEGILQHRWTHRSIDSKSLRRQVNALKQAPTLSIEDHELGSAVSVHQSRFLKMAAAIRHDTLSDLAKEGNEDTDIPPSVVDGEYRPNPVDTKETALPQWFQPHRELVATQMHFDWCRGKALAGWKYGDVRDDAQLIHPCMLPMRALDETTRARNFCSVDEIIKCVVALGVHVTYRRPPKGKQCQVPFLVDHVQLSWDVMMLIDLLAENSHEVWATEYTAAGWRLGPEFDEAAKTHPSLKPYMLLDEHDKTLTREGVTSVLKSCIHLGCKFSISHRGRKA
jgi:serine/threonine protein kinase